MIPPPEYPALQWLHQRPIQTHKTSTKDIQLNTQHSYKSITETSTIMTLLFIIRPCLECTQLLCYKMTGSSPHQIPPNIAFYYFFLNTNLHIHNVHLNPPLSNKKTIVCTSKHAFVSFSSLCSTSLGF